jgi:glutamate-1-semialdehyde aminotransferase
MLSNGVYLPPSAYESWFLSDALLPNDIRKTITVLETFSDEEP